jgi:glyoxylase-like metal-dependent hydrolase (beta-lactamase superfamily II)
MLGRWVRAGLWRPYELACRRFPLAPFEVAVEELVPGVRVIRIENWVTRLIARVGGGYSYSVSYLVGDELLVDTGFPWAGHTLVRALDRLGVLDRLSHVVNTHSHEDHVGNDDLLAARTRAVVLAHPTGVAAIRWPARRPWYRGFMFGPFDGVPVTALGTGLRAAGRRFDVVHTPGHTADHVCLFEPDAGWLFAGDLYVDERLDAQLADVDGPRWIASLEHALTLDVQVLFDGHGLVVRGRDEVRAALDAKRRFLEDVRARTRAESPHARSLPELTRRVFPRARFADRVIGSEGRLSALTALDFSRSHLVGSFLPEATVEQTADAERAP